MQIYEVKVVLLQRIMSCSMSEVSHEGSKGRAAPVIYDHFLSAYTGLCVCVCVCVCVCDVTAGRVFMF